MTIVREDGRCSKITALSKFKFIRTIASSQSTKEALKQSQVLSQWFIDIRESDKYESYDTRIVWIEILGVPPVGWHKDNFIQIAELWGRIMSVDKDTGIRRRAATSHNPKDSRSKALIIVETDPRVRKLRYPRNVKSHNNLQVPKPLLNNQKGEVGRAINHKEEIED
ncbi:hypothetical protein Cgig2_021756 [Carnegiea gigantea]|uniref:DUF4283 domain-containing protein n=1 Tax=Carnegiea gigantea TaxID=171969 RepID=A0A9Q1JS10_9CARY|nr:hypothetical protein Cgig2_021756 [Carnegiea gigantea]